MQYESLNNFFGRIGECDNVTVADVFHMDRERDSLRAQLASSNTLQAESTRKVLTLSTALNNLKQQHHHLEAQNNQLQQDSRQLVE